MVYRRCLVLEDFWQFVSSEKQISPCRIENPVGRCSQMWEKKSRFFCSGDFMGLKHENIEKHKSFWNRFFPEFSKSSEIINASFSISNNIDFWFRKNHMIEKSYSKIETSNFWKSKKWQWNRFSQELWKIVSYENPIAPCRIKNAVDLCLQMSEMKSRFFSSGAFRGRKNKESNNYDFVLIFQTFSN